MSPRGSKASVAPSGETSTDIHVPSLVVKAILRASARGLLMSAAGSGFLSVSPVGGSVANASGLAARPIARATRVRSVNRRWRMPLSSWDPSVFVRGPMIKGSGGLSVRGVGGCQPGSDRGDNLRDVKTRTAAFLAGVGLSVALVRHPLELRLLRHSPAPRPDTRLEPIQVSEQRAPFEHAAGRSRYRIVPRFRWDQSARVVSEEPYRFG